MQANTNIGLGFKETLSGWILAVCGAICMLVGAIETIIHGFSGDGWHWGPGWEAMKDWGASLFIILFCVISGIYSFLRAWRYNALIIELKQEHATEDPKQRTVSYDGDNENPGSMSIELDYVLQELDGYWKAGKGRDDPKFWDDLTQTWRVKMYGEARKRALT